MSNDISIHKAFWYGWKLDTSYFNFEWTTKEFCMKLNKKRDELIYNADWKYKKWNECHNCGRDLLENPYGNNIKSVFSNIDEEMILVWPFHDKYGEHHINICEDCIIAYLSEYVSNPYDETAQEEEAPAEDDGY